MPGVRQIPWEEYLTTYNRMHKTDFKTPQDMIATLYEREGTLLKVADIMGISDNTINLFMKKHGLPRLPRGHRGISEYQTAYCKIKNPSQYKHREIAEMLGCSIGYISNLKKRSNRHVRPKPNIGEKKHEPS